MKSFMVNQTDRGHPPDELLLALVHQQTFDEAIAIRAHVMSCAACSGRLHELSAGEIAIAALLETLDHAPAAAGARAPFGARNAARLRRIVLVAGSAATLVAAAAAVVPNSPLRRWLAGHPRPELPTPGTRPTPPAPQPAAAPVALPLASGIAIPAPATLVVVFRHDQPSGVVEITRTDSGDVTFRSRGGAAAYAVAEHRVTIDNRVPAEVYLIDVPRSVQQVRIRVASRTLMRWPEDSAKYTLPNEPHRARLRFGTADPGSR